MAGLRDDFTEPDERALAKALARLCAIDSRRWIAFLLGVLQAKAAIDVSILNEAERQMLLVTHYTFWQTPLPGSGFNTLMVVG